MVAAADQSGWRPRISVVIPARNEALTIEGAIQPLLADPVAAEVEVIVADGGSTDGTAAIVEALSRRDPRVTLVRNPLRTTPEGLNAAIRASTGDVIVRMDGHAEPSSDYLTACLRVLRESGAWNVGGRMRKTGVTRAGRAGAAATSSAFGIGGGRRFHLLNEPADVDGVWLGCWPRWVFERIGLFDPELVQVEDEELNQRITDAGGLIRFDPSISAVYHSRRSWGALIHQYFRYGRSKVRVTQKRPSVLRARHLAPATLVGFLAVSLAASLVTPAALVLLVAGAAAWGCLAALAAPKVARANDARTLDVVIAFGCIHLAYGCGTWTGIVRFAPRWVVRRQGRIPALKAPG